MAMNQSKLNQAKTGAQPAAAGTPPKTPDPTTVSDTDRAAMRAAGIPDNVGLGTSKDYPDVTIAIGALRPKPAGSLFCGWPIR